MNNATPSVAPRWLVLWITTTWLFASPLHGQVQGIKALLSSPPTATAGARISVVLYYANASTKEFVPSFPSLLEGRLLSGEKAQAVSLELEPSQGAPLAPIAPGSFRHERYLLQLPISMEGRVILEIPALGVNPIVLSIEKPQLAENSQSPKSSPVSSSASNAGGSFQTGSKTNRFNAVDYFKRYFFPYEPFYFIAGSDSPNAKFQISFKYRLLNSDGYLANQVPILKGLHLAYTQTSLWDLNKPSAPFLDSSYKPEFHYAIQQIDGGRWADWFHLDLQGGLKHESNGREGDASRSQNTAYFRPTLWFGTPDDFFVSFAPSAWVYIGDMNDNSDLQDYRGYVDLRTIAGWPQGFQLSAYSRMGNDANRGSVLLDLTYPMSELFSRSFSLYLHAQFFTGYGESFLLYKERSSAVRVGISLFR